MEKIEFLASLPDMQSAIMLHGGGDGARMKLDIPASEAEKYGLIQIKLAKKSFKVTIEYEENSESDW